MPRLRQLPEQGARRTITFRPELDIKLAVMAAERRVPISTVVEELIEIGLRPPVSPESMAVDFPPNWDGSDLRERLYWLRMTQQELAKSLKKPQNTVNEWVNGNHPAPAKYLTAIQKILRRHEPGPILGFRTGSRSPKV